MVEAGIVIYHRPSPNTSHAKRSAIKKLLDRNFSVNLGFFIFKLKVCELARDGYSSIAQIQGSSSKINKALNSPQSFSGTAKKARPKHQISNVPGSIPRS